MFNDCRVAQSLSMSFRVGQKLQNVARDRKSTTNVATDSPGWQKRLWNLYLCTISDCIGLWCSVITRTSSVYDLLPGFVGDTKLQSNLYVEGPLPLRRLTFFVPIINAIHLEEVPKSFCILRPLLSASIKSLYFPIYKTWSLVERI